MKLNVLSRIEENPNSVLRFASPSRSLLLKARVRKSFIKDSILLCNRDLCKISFYDAIIRRRIFAWNRHLKISVLTPLVCQPTTVSLSFVLSRPLGLHSQGVGRSLGARVRREVRMYGHRGRLKTESWLGFHSFYLIIAHIIKVLCKKISY